MSDSISKFKFMKLRKVFLAISAILVMASIYLFVSTGQNKYGIDFVGGTEVVVRFDKKLPIKDLRTALAKGGFSDAVVQQFDDAAGSSEFSIKVKGLDNSESGDESEVSTKLDNIFSGMNVQYEKRKEDFVGPVIGEKIKEDGLFAIIYSLAGILAYVALRFEFKFALGSIIALAHDVSITLGLFIITGREINVPVLAALLTIIGYSLNDTIVVFDRVRENLAAKTSKKSKLYKLNNEQVVDVSINQTLSRTILTSLTTLFVVTTLWLMTTGGLSDLAFTLVVGVIVGTYSSIYIACPTLLAKLK